MQTRRRRARRGSRRSTVEFSNAGSGELIAATDDARQRLVEASQRVHADHEEASLAFVTFGRRTDWTRRMQTALLIVSLILLLVKDLLPGS